MTSFLLFPVGAASVEPSPHVDATRPACALQCLFAMMDPCELVQHTAWVRRLALALVGREDVADDLVQETWLVALRSPPDTDRPVRPWLAGVLRNLAYKRWRSDGRRHRRETSAADLPHETPTPERLLDRAQTERRLAELLRELDEPYRSTLRLRYDEMLSSVEIARRQRLPAGTVRWRLKSGVDRLRARLAPDDSERLRLSLPDLPDATREP